MQITKLKLLMLASVIFIGMLLISNFTFIGGQHGQLLQEVDPTAEWEFFENELLTPTQARRIYGTGEKITLPHLYKDYYDTATMYGTYVTKIKLPPVENGENRAFYVPFQYSSYKLYVNQQLVAKTGIVGQTKDEQIPETAPKIGQIHTSQQEVYITLQIANFHSIRGGFSKPIYVGQFSDLVKKHNSNIISHFFLNGIIFIASIFALLFGLFNNRDKRILLLAAFCFTIAIRSIFARPFLYAITIFNVPWEVAVKIEGICSILALSIAITIFMSFLATALSKKGFILIQLLLACQIGVTLFTKPLLFQQTFNYVLAISLVTLFYLLIKGLLRTKFLTSVLSVHLAGSLVMFMAAVHDFTVVQKGLHVAMLLQNSQAMYIIFICFTLSWEYAQKQRDMQRLQSEILALNASLDLKIKERTAQLEEANQTLQQLATRDALTGIANRYAFDYHLETYFEQTLQMKANLSLLLIDLDYFKKYNDYYGHTMGDTLLQQVVSVIEEHVPAEALFARYGGEEFAIIYPLVDEQTVIQLGQTIVTAVAAQQFEHAQHPHKYASISVGGYTMTGKDTFSSIKQLINASDERLYTAKHRGRNQFVY